MKYNTEGKPKKYKCSQCQFTASDEGIVSAHQVRVHTFTYPIETLNT